MDRTPGRLKRGERKNLDADVEERENVKHPIRGFPITYLFANHVMCWEGGLSQAPHQNDSKSLLRERSVSVCK